MISNISLNCLKKITNLLLYDLVNYKRFEVDLTFFKEKIMV